MTLRRATQYALTGMWFYLVVSLIQTALAIWDPGFYYGNPTLMRFLLILGDVLGPVPLIIFFNALSKGQSRE